MTLKILSRAPERLFFLFSFLFILIFSVPPVRAEENLRAFPASIHIHSNISSGGKSIREIASLAKKQNVRFLLLTDLYQEHFEYGLKPFEKFIKKTYSRGSIMKSGPRHYFEEIQRARAQNPGVEIIDGTAATPFYYWSGGLYPGPLVLNNRAKDLLVLGLGDPEKYKNLPVLGNKNSGFDAYSGDAFSAPYQKFIDAALHSGGLVFWSHPGAYEHIAFNRVFFNLNVYLDTPPYGDSLLNTFRYTGFGIFSTELAQIHLPDHQTLPSPGNIWDRVLLEYCAGSRREPAWAIGETDFNGFPEGIHDLDAILNMVISERETKESVLAALRLGRLYLIMAQSRTNRIVLDEFSVGDGAEGGKASLGETIPVRELPFIRIRAHFPEEIPEKIVILLIRNGKIISQWTESSSFNIAYQDRENIQPGKSYYRMIAYAEHTADRILTNPVFADRK